MHRAGTSTIARAVNLLGADLGPAAGLMAPTPDNPEGYWERADVCALQERALAALRSTWDSAGPLPAGWEREPALGPLRAELTELVRRDFGGAALFAWKDPRTCLLLPLWREALAGLGIGLAVVFATRNPLDVARSLERRDGIPVAKGFGIWCAHTISGLRAMRGLPAAFVSYDAFLADWERELRRVALALGLAWPADEAGLRAAMAVFVRPALRHSASTPGDLRAAGAPAPVIELAGLLERLAAGAAADDPAVLARVDALWGEFTAWGGFTRADLDALFVTRRELRETRDALARAQARLAETEARLADTVLQLEQERGRVAQLLGSWSWRVTGPLRAVHRRLAGG